MKINLDENTEIQELVDFLDDDSPALDHIEKMNDTLKEFFVTHPADLAYYLNNSLDCGWPEFAKDMAAFVSYGEPVFRNKKFAGVGWLTKEQFYNYLEYQENQ